jgi:uncharacterized protein (DUF433 family)
MTDSNIIQAFSADHVVRLTGLSKAQLRYWDKTGFFAPTFAAGNRRSPFSGLYSFRDVVGLRTISVLRNEHKISLQHLREVAKELERHMANPWSTIMLSVRGKVVHFQEPDTRRVREALTGQYVADIPLEQIANDVAAEAGKLKQRSQKQIGKIARNRYTQHNAWVIAGTRIPVKAIWRFHKAGYSAEQILKEYPSLTIADIKRAIERERKSALSA